MKDQKISNREVKIKRKAEGLFFNSIIVSIDGADKFEEMKIIKIRLTKNTGHDWLINHIPQSIRKGTGSFKDKFISLFKTNTPKETANGEKKSK